MTQITSQGSADWKETAEMHPFSVKDEPRWSQLQAGGSGSWGELGIQGMAERWWKGEIYGALFGFFLPQSP